MLTRPVRRPRRCRLYLSFSTIRFIVPPTLHPFPLFSEIGLILRPAGRAPALPGKRSRRRHLWLARYLSARRRYGRPLECSLAILRIDSHFLYPSPQNRFPPVLPPVSELGVAISSRLHVLQPAKLPGFNPRPSRNSPVCGSGRSETKPPPARERSSGKLLATRTGPCRKQLIRRPLGALTAFLG